MVEALILLVKQQFRQTPCILDTTGNNTLRMGFQQPHQCSCSLHSFTEVNPPVRGARPSTHPLAPWCNARHCEQNQGKNCSMLLPFFVFFFLIKVQFDYNIVLLITIQQIDSVIHIYIYSFSYSFPLWSFYLLIFIINLSSFNLLPSTTPVLLDFTYVPLEVLSWPESLFAVFSVTSYKKTFWPI